MCFFVTYSWRHYIQYGDAAFVRTELCTLFERTDSGFPAINTYILMDITDNSLIISK
jgi:hypothetical protein